MVYKPRKLIILHFGYDPKMRNIDQSPFHGNEGGCAGCNTLALKGAPTVPLVEDHAATRDRWSLNSVTDSCEERVRNKLPGFELMFRFDWDEKAIPVAAVCCHEEPAIQSVRGDGAQRLLS